jgi:hypothetical protein
MMNDVKKWIIMLIFTYSSNSFYISFIIKLSHHQIVK